VTGRRFVFVSARTKSPRCPHNLRAVYGRARCVRRPV